MSGWWRNVLAALSASALVFVVACPEETGGAENSAALCSDGIDNDDDRMVDCDDIGCTPFCGGDGDLDGDADTDAEMDGDTDVEADGDADTDGDSDGDSDADTDADADADEDPYPDCETDDDCPPNMRCYDYLLDGVFRCAPAGHYCTLAEPCVEGTHCDTVFRWDGVGAYCLSEPGGCAETSDCPDGFACEAGACVDRRFTCGSNEDCPWWSRCTTLPSGVAICEGWQLERCAIADECGGPAVCVDVDGDGDTECQSITGSTCETNADCSGMVCGDQDGERGTECGAIGPCLTTADCPGTLECVDANADGQQECQPTGGACMVDADCPERQICFDTDSAGGAECVSP